MCRFVPNFVSYVSVKYHLNWFTVRKIIAKNKKSELFIETQYTIRVSLSMSGRTWSD